MTKTTSDRTFILVLLISLSLLISGCTTPRLSVKRTSELKQAFVGREFVFRTDWYEDFAIFQGKHGHKAVVSVPEGTTPHRSLRKRAEELGAFQASAGTVAHITDIQTEYDWMLHVVFSTEKGQQGQLSIRRFGENPITDDIVTIAWVEDQLTRSTIEFLDSTDVTINKAEMALPTPPPQPTLTAAPKANHIPTPKAITEPAIRHFEATATPSPVRHGETLKLMLNYELESGNRSEIEVTETRSLLFNGKTLPGYPKQKTGYKRSGQQASTFRQRIPSKAKPGTYTYKGEICIETGCTSRLMKFTIEP